MTRSAAPADDRRRRGRRRWPLLLLVLLGAAGWLVHHARQRLAALPPLRTVQLENRDLRITISTSGTVEPDEVVEVGALVAGKITAFGANPRPSTKPVPIGARVAKDQVLAQIDRPLYEVALSKSRAASRLAAAEIQRLETQLGQAARELHRAERLRATNPESAYDKAATAHKMAQAELAIARAQLEAAEAEVRQAEINLERTFIRAPVDGVVIDRRVNLGQNVGPGSSGLFLLARDLKRMRIRASVSETDIGKIRVGQPVSFTVDAQRDVQRSGRVEQILLNARVEGAFVTYDVLIGIDSTTEMLLPHMTADVEFETVKRENAWLVPGESLKWWPRDEQVDSSIRRLAKAADHDDAPPREGEIAYLWVPAKEGRVRAVRVRVGINDGVQTEVIAPGLRDKMPVVVGVVRQTTLARIIPSVKTLR